MKTLFDAVVEGSHASEDRTHDMLLQMIDAVPNFGGFDVASVAIMSLIMQEKRLALLHLPDTHPEAKALITDEEKRYAKLRQDLKSKLGNRFDALYSQARADDAQASQFNRLPALPEFNEDGTLKR